MSIFNSLVALAVVLFIIAFFGHMSFKLAMKSGLGLEQNPYWFSSAFILWMVALASSYMDQVILFLVLGGPIAFVFGFTYQAIRQTIKKHFA